MEGQSRPRRRAPHVLRCFTPTRLQDDLLAAVYDRLLAAGSSAGRRHDRPQELELAGIAAEQDQPATTGG
jgi:hypothetical protein